MICSQDRLLLDIAEKHIFTGFPLIVSLAKLPSTVSDNISLVRAKAGGQSPETVDRAPGQDLENAGLPFARAVGKGPFNLSFSSLAGVNRTWQVLPAF